MGPGSGTSSRLSVKMRGLRNELEPFWAWKCESPELPGRVWLALWPAANPRCCRPLCVRAESAVETGLKLKKFWKWWSPERQKSAKKCKMVMLRNGSFGNLWKWYMLRNGKSGLKMGVSCTAHTQYAYIWKYTPPPPPPPPGSPHSLLVLYMKVLFFHFPCQFPSLKSMYATWHAVKWFNATWSTPVWSITVCLKLPFPLPWTNPNSYTKTTTLIPSPLISIPKRKPQP